MACFTYCHVTCTGQWMSTMFQAVSHLKDETDEIFESPCTQDPTTSSALIPTTEISPNSSMSDVVQFLKSNGIPEKFCCVFEGKV